jgi:hypothetical protein
MNLAWICTSSRPHFRPHFIVQVVHIVVVVQVVHRLSRSNFQVIVYYI